MKRFILLALVLCLAKFSFAQEVSADSVGIWAVYGNSVERMEKLNFQNTKTGGAWAVGLTGGLSKSKMKLEFKGANSPVSFSGTAHFRLYFGNAPVEKVASLYMFSPNYSIRDFDVAKFEIKGTNRRLTTGSVSIMTGVKTGAKGTDDVQVSYTRVRDGVYDVEVTGKPGQYCFIFTAQGAGAYSGVFDFAIE